MLRIYPVVGGENTDRPKLILMMLVIVFAQAAAL